MGINLIGLIKGIKKVVTLKSFNRYDQSFMLVITYMRILEGEKPLSRLLFSCLVVFHSLRPHGLQHARLPCPSPSPGVCSNLCPLSQWCHPTISSSVIPFSSRLQSFPASESLPMTQFFTSGSQSIGASASTSVLAMTIQDWFPLGLIGLLSMQFKGLSRVFSNTTVQKYLFFGYSILFRFD